MSSVSFHCSYKKAFLSFLAILWNSASDWYTFLFLLCFHLSSFLSYYKDFLRKQLCLYAFLFLGDVFDTTSYTTL